MDYNKFFTETSKRRYPSALRELVKAYIRMMGNGKFYALSGGLPPSDIFQFTEATFKMKDGSELKLDKNMMDIAQQYGMSEGYEPLVNMLRDFQSRLHNPPIKDWNVIVTSGCQEAVSKAFDMALNEGDVVFGSDDCYSGAMEPLLAIGATYIGVHQDSYGINPTSLRNAVSQWREKIPNKANIKMKMIYIVPNGGNPKSTTTSVQRRKEIYKIAQEYDLLILEDDPYQFIVFDQELPLSFLSLDVDGRVIRCDSFSKTIAPGFRLGCLTAASQITAKILQHIQISTQQPCCLSQVVLYNLLLKWGFDGYIRNGKNSCEILKKQKDLAVKYAKLWLKDLAEWAEPTGGMFIWMKIKNTKSSETICKKAFFRNTLFAPGKLFKYDKSDSPYIRVSFSNATEDDFNNAFRILSEVIEEEQSGKYSNSNSRENGVDKEE